MKKTTPKIVAVLLTAVIILSTVPISVFAVNPSITVSSVRESILAPGVTQDVAIAHNGDGGRVAYYVAEADINREDVNIYANYKDNQCTQLGMQKLSDQVAAAEAKHVGENYSVVASCNGAFYNMVNGQPIGAFVMNGVDVTNTEDPRLPSMSFFAVLKDGTPIIAYGTEYYNYRGKMQEAVAGRYRLIEKGKICAGLPQADYTSRSAIGITAEGKIVIMVADGKQAPVSVGLSNYEQALVMQSYGCVEALELDGGGSTTYGCRPEGENSFRVINTPSDGYDRSVSNSLMIVSTAAPSGVFDHAVVRSDYSYLTPYSSVNIEAVGADSISKPAPLPDDIQWSVSDSSMGSIEDGVFTAGEDTGTVTINAMSGGKTVGSTQLNIVYPDELRFTAETFSVKYGSVNSLPLAAYYGGNEVAINENDVYCITGPADALIDRPDLYGYVEGLDYYAPPEGCGVRCTYLNAILTWVLEDETMDEDEAMGYIITMDVELRRDNETVFDFENRSGGDTEFAWKREVSNTTTLDGSYYTVEDKDGQINVNYTYGIDLRELDLPVELTPLWEAFGSALGDSIWGAMLKLSNKVDPKTNISIRFQVDPNMIIGNLDEITFSSELFTLDRNTIEIDAETNTITANCVWNSAFIQQAMNQDTGAIDLEAVNPISVMSNLNFTVKDDAKWKDDGTLDFYINGDVTYDLIMLSTNVYRTAGSEPTLAKYQYVDEETGAVGISFYNTYKTFEDRFTVSQELAEGWSGNMFFENGKAVTGQKIIDGTMCTFDENGIYQPDYLYTGYYKSADGWMYFRDNEALTGWVFIDREWHYFKSDFLAPTGTYTISGMDYKFEGEQGKSIGAWNGRRFYYCRTYYKNEWAVIEGEKYYFDNSGYRYQDGKFAVSYVGSFLGAYEFDKEGKLIGTISGVFRDSSNGLYYYSEDGALFNGGLFQWNGDYYYAKTNYSLAVTDWYVSEDNTNGLMPAGTYKFGEDAKMISLNGVFNIDGAWYYYVDNVPQQGLGLVEVDGDYYYVRSNGRLATEPWYVSADAANGLVPQGTYEFGEDGKMVLFTGIVEKDGCLWYYEKNVPQYGLGLVKFEDNYYYVRSNGHLAVEPWYVSAEAANGFMPKGTYEFGEDGKMVLFTGIVEKDGYLWYYDKNVPQYGLGLVKFEDNYYYVRSNGHLATELWYVSAEASNGLVPADTYEFGEDGKMVLYTGIKAVNGEIHYYINGIKQFGTGLIRENDSYYFIRSNGCAATEPWHVSEDASNGWFRTGTYTFGEDGKMITDADNLKPADSHVKVDESRKLIIADIGNYSLIDDLVYNGDTYCTVKASEKRIRTGTVVDVIRNGEVVNSYTVALRGDVDADTYSDGIDSVMISLIVNGLLDESNLSAAQLAAADVNSDGIVDETDVNLAAANGLSA